MVSSRSICVACLVGLGAASASTFAPGAPTRFVLPQVCTDPASNETHIASVDISMVPNVTSKSDKLPATGIQFRWTPADLNRSWHNAPARLLSVSVDAQMKVIVSGAPHERIWDIGEVHLEEDLVGRGHESINLGKARHSLFVHLGSSFPDGPCANPTSPSSVASSPVARQAIDAASNIRDAPQFTTIYKVCNNPRTNDSHIIPMNIALTASSGGAISSLIKTQSVQWSWTPADHNHSFHNAPARQFIANLDAPHKVTVSGAPYERVFQPGEIMFVEDQLGKGHCTANLGKARMTLYLPVDASFDAGPCEDPSRATAYEAVVV